MFMLAQQTRTRPHQIQCSLVAGEDAAILGLSSALVTRACKAAPSSPQYAVEAGYQALLQGDVQGALAQYSRASHLHELDMEAMYGSIECDLLSGKARVATAHAAAVCKTAMLGILMGMYVSSQ